MILTVRPISSPPSPRENSTSQCSFLALRWLLRRCGKQKRLSKPERGRRWPAFLLVVGVAACDDLSRFGLQPAPNAAEPLAAASAAPTLLPSTPPPGRAVATMPANRLGVSSIQPIVVRGNES